MKTILELAAAAALLCAAACAEKTKEEPAAESAPATTETPQAAATSEEDLLHKPDPIGKYGAGIVLTAATPLNSVDRKSVV